LFHRCLVLARSRLIRRSLNNNARSRARLLYPACCRVSPSIQ
jgi:hypothetical protein